MNIEQFVVPGVIGVMLLFALTLGLVTLYSRGGSHRR
jgi:hypothetical protein